MANSVWNPANIREIVEGSLRLVLPSSTPLPPVDEDWIESGLVDSMAHVEFLLCVEKALNLPNLFGKGGSAPPQSIRTTIDAVQRALEQRAENQAAIHESRPNSSEPSSDHAGIVGWGSALGSVCVSIDRVEAEFGCSIGKLKERAGIETIRRVSAGEDEITLALSAAQKALMRGGISARALDYIVGTSETSQGLPSFAASLHSALLARTNCRALDVGGGCVGLIHCLSMANSLLSDPSVNCILVASADVHSRILAPGKVSWEFGGLFGDGASAFVLRRVSHKQAAAGFVLRASVGGCAGSFSSALQIHPRADGAIALEFDGEALAHAAIEVLGQTISDLKMQVNVSLGDVHAFALHQPNHRLTEILIRRARLPAEKVPLVAKSCGNLGASTCGVAMSAALDSLSQKTKSERGPILVASVGPGMLWAGIALT
jgi:3-oxoacyl-[acyl-carrier-protein] synthase III